MVFTNDLDILDMWNIFIDGNIHLSNSLDDFWLFLNDFPVDGDLNLFNNSVNFGDHFIVLVDLLNIDLLVVVNININFFLDDSNDRDGDINVLDVLLLDDLLNFLDDLDLLLDVLDDLLGHLFDVLDFLLDVDGYRDFLDGNLHILVMNLGRVSRLRKVKIVLCGGVVNGSSVSPGIFVTGFNWSVRGQAIESL